MKTVKVRGKVQGKTEESEIGVPGILSEDRLTPKMAIQAAITVFGHRSGILVSDPMTAYRVSKNSVRKLGL